MAARMSRGHNCAADIRQRRAVEGERVSAGEADTCICLGREWKGNVYPSPSLQDCNQCNLHQVSEGFTGGVSGALGGGRVADVVFGGDSWGGFVSGQSQAVGHIDF
jgi:hypothetical protein